MKEQETLNIRSKYWPTLADQSHLRLASERAFSVFFLLAGSSGLIITIINIPFLFSHPVTVGLGAGIAVLCLLGPIFVIGSARFDLNVRIFGHTIAILMCGLSLAAQEMVSPSNLLFLPAVLTMTLATGWRDGLFTLTLALCAYVGTFLISNAEWAVALPDVNTTTLIAGQMLAACFIFAGTAVFRHQMVYAARELERQTALAEESSLAKSEFLATVSHEVRTPLNGVLGMAQILQASELQPDQQRQVSTILQCGKLLLHTLNDVLDLSRIEAGHLSLELRPIDLRDLIGTLGPTYEGVAEAKNVRFAARVDPALKLDDKRIGDESRLAQILHNLLSNAVKFTSEGEVELAVLAGGSDTEVLFLVRDSGIGLSDQQQSRIFDKFVQADQSTSREYGGSGLGLAIVSHLVELMHGKITVESALGQGSCFTVRLPLPVADSAAEATVEIPVAAGQIQPNRELKILVVDDVRINLHVMRAMLDQLGYEADYVASGEEAVQVVSRIHFDVIFLDISMPGMGGIEALEKIRELEAAQNRRAATVIAQTANVMRHQLESYEQAGFDGALGKPIQLGALRERLSTVAVQVRSRAPTSSGKG